jgi:hypothetical protein
MPENGLFAWADLSTPDLEKAGRFYEDVMGWERQSLGPDAGDYGFFLSDGKMAAGVGPQMDPNQPPSWNPYVYVDDLDAVVAKAEDNGATVIVEPMDVMDAGRMAVIVDPTGAALGLFQAGQHQGADAFNDPGFMTWNELHTRDVEKAKAFYTAIFPWTADTQDMGGMQYTMIMTSGGTMNAGMMAMGPDMPPQVPSYWATYFRVADTDKAVEIVKAGGGTVRQGPQDAPYGRMAVVADPLGATFAVIAPAPQS